MELMDFLMAAGGILSGGLLGWFIKEARFKAKAETTDEHHTKIIDELVAGTKVQTKNNELQQKAIDNMLSTQRIFEERMLDRRKEFEDYKKANTTEFAAYRKFQQDENAKVNKALSANTTAIASLDATMKGLDTVLGLLFKKMD